MGALDGIVVPDVYPEFSSRYILTTSWITGRFFCYWLQSNELSISSSLMIEVLAANFSQSTSTLCCFAGEKLSDSSSNDVLALCDTILNCYLIQLLETGFLHADPHPGNLLRTPDGRVAILDFGLMSEVTDEQRVALVEYITHLALEDWDAIADDLVTLGFVPDGYDDFRDLDIKPVLKEMMGQLISGGEALSSSYSYV